jgi:predicted RND superfamily exporter protein
LEAALAAADRPGFALSASGVPYVVELIRRHLLRDLRVFSLASLLLFGLTVALVYRSLPVVLGALVSCLTACVLTFLVLHLLKLQLGLLTANLATIVFVLTLSHVIFLSARWRSESGPEAVAVAVKETLPASFWCMVTTLLGFLSLLFASARPLRELGLAGAIGAASAMAVAFLLYPRFLEGSLPQTPENAKPKPQISFRGLAIGTVVLGLLVAFALPGLHRLNTDPSLLSYFQKGGDLARGLTLIDQDGGSSPLDLVVRAPDGAALHTAVAYQRLQALQTSLEEDPAVGTALSLPVLLAEAQQVPFAAFLAPDQLLALLDSPAFGSLGRSFITEDRRQARIFLRMREGGRQGSRLEVVERVVAQVREAGLEPELVGGLYDLQGRLSRLVRSSVLMGLTGLAVLFTLISAYVSRRLRTTLVMLAGVVAVPILIFGTLGYLGLPLDVISSPAANVAVAVGIDSMIHLVLRRRRLRLDGLTAREAWNAARQQMAAPILAAALVIAAGFGIFVLSSFPPTRHFGLAVVVGTLSAAALALIALPYLASRERDRLA